jgi:hypothetical protein
MDHTIHQARTSRLRIVSWTVGAVSLILIAFSSHASPAIFQSLVALLSGIGGCAIFIVTWQSPTWGRNPFWSLLAVASLLLGVVLLLNGAISALAALLMDPELPVRLSVAGHGIEAAALFIAPFLLKGKAPRSAVVTTGVLLISLSLVAALLWPLIPLTSLLHPGDTAFAVATGLVRCILLAGALVQVTLRHGDLDPVVFVLLVASIGLKLYGQAVGVTLAQAPSGLEASVLMAGLASVFLLYQAFALQADRSSARQRADAHRARTLDGLIPICMNCKKIQTSDGDWEQLEAYISARSGAEFSHGICPDCASEVFRDMAHDGSA